MASRDSQIDKPQRGCPKRAELPDVNKTQARKALLRKPLTKYELQLELVQVLTVLLKWKNAN